MTSRNSMFDIVISSEEFEQMMVRVVLPDSLVDEVVKHRNNRALDVVLAVLRGEFSNQHNRELGVLGSDELGFMNFEFLLVQPGV